MIHHCTIFKKDTGEIVQYSNFMCQDDIEQISRNFFGRLLFFGADTHDYVELPSNAETDYVAVMGEQVIVAQRPDLVVFVADDKTTIQAGGEDSTTLTGLPDPCQIIVDDPDPAVETQTYEVTGGGFIFAADDPGVYTIEVRRWPFLPWKVEITAL